MTAVSRFLDVHSHLANLFCKFFAEKLTSLRRLPPPCVRFSGSSQSTVLELNHQRTAEAVGGHQNFQEVNPNITLQNIGREFLSFTYVL